MALDKLVDSTQLDSDLTSVANAIRTKGGTSAQLAFPAGFVSAIGAIPTGGTNISTNELNNTLNEMQHALETGVYSTGTTSVASYFPANTESVFCDTGYDGNVRGMVIYDVAMTEASRDRELYQAIAFFGAAATPGADQGMSSVSCASTLRTAVERNFINNSTYSTCRLAGGKLYIKPKYADTSRTYFLPGHTYRWIAWPIAN